MDANARSSEMMMRKHPATVAGPIGLVMLLLLQATGLAQSARIAVGPVANPAAAIRMGHFAEPLVATAATTAEEDLALAEAVENYERRAKPDDVSSLTAFVSTTAQVAH
jgi:hypothetical protein